jgi:hypothetical protein
MIVATLTMLRARHEEKVAATGVIVAMFADDPSKAVRRLEEARDAARDCERALGRGATRQQRDIYRNVAAWADDMLGPVRQVAGLAGVRSDTEDPS